MIINSVESTKIDLGITTGPEALSSSAVKLSLSNLNDIPFVSNESVIYINCRILSKFYKSFVKYRKKIAESTVMSAEKQAEKILEDSKIDAERIKNVAEIIETRDKIEKKFLDFCPPTGKSIGIDDNVEVIKYAATK